MADAATNATDSGSSPLVRKPSVEFLELCERSRGNYAYVESALQLILGSDTVADCAGQVAFCVQLHGLSCWCVGQTACRSTFSRRAQD